MAIFGLGKKKEEVNGGCDCGGACETKDPVKEESGCCCGGNCNLETMTAAEVAKKEGSTIKVLGSGCAKCNQLEAATKEALAKLGMDDTIDHVTDFSQIAAYGVMTTPALVVDGKVVSYGKVLKTEDVVKILQKVRG
jgi:small redox-active disulfide protein 2